MKVLVTGGAGFIGSYTVNCLISRGFDVTVLDNLSTGNRNNLIEKVNLIYGDILDKELLKKFTYEKYDAVIHLAAQTSVADSMEDPLVDMSLNIEGTLNVLQFARHLNAKKMVFASTAAVYGDVAAYPIKEHFTLNPTSGYGISKMASEHYIRVFCESYNISYSILRYSNVYGPNQSNSGEGGVIKKFLDQIQQDSILEIHGDGNQSRDFIFVEDVAEANVLAGSSNHNGVYNISSNTEVSINELIQIIEELTGKPVAKKYTSQRKGDIVRSCLANDKARKELGWNYMIGTKEGIKKMLNNIN